MKIALLITALLISFQSKSNGISHSTGIGLQYSGVLGYQISSTTEEHNFRGSIGLFGIGAGYDYLATDNFSIGVTATFITLQTGSINFNYYPSGKSNSGWQIGLDLGHIANLKSSDDVLFDNHNDNDFLWVSIGYKF